MPRPTKVDDAALECLKRAARIRLEAHTVSTKALAAELGLSERLVSHHVERLMRKLAVSREAQSEKITS